MFHFRLYSPDRMRMDCCKVDGDVGIANHRYRLVISAEEAIAVHDALRRLHLWITKGQPLAAADRLIVLQKSKILIPVEGLHLDQRMARGEPSSKQRHIEKSGHGLYCLVIDRAANLRVILPHLMRMIPVRVQQVPSTADHTRSSDAQTGWQLSD